MSLQFVAIGSRLWKHSYQSNNVHTEELKPVHMAHGYCDTDCLLVHGCV